MGKFKLLLLSTFIFGQLAFACGSTITGGGAGSTEQTNTSSECPNTQSQASTTPTYNTSYGPSYSPAAKAAEDAAKAEARKACLNATESQFANDTEDCMADVKYQADTMKNGCFYGSGELVWTFLYSGPSFSMSIALPMVVYPAAVGNEKGCVVAIDNAAELTTSKCKTTGQTVRNKACSFN